MSNGGLVLDVPGHALRGAGFGRPAGNVGSVECAVGYKGRNHPALDLIPDVLIAIVGVHIQPLGIREEPAWKAAPWEKLDHH